jgi:hypothetical protein
MEEDGQGADQRGEELELKRAFRYQHRWTGPQTGPPGPRTGGTGAKTGPPGIHTGAHRSVASSAISKDPGGQPVPAPVQTGETGL